MKFLEVFDGRLGSSKIFLILQRILNQSRPVINVLLNSWLKMLTKKIILKSFSGKKIKLN